MKKISVEEYSELIKAERKKRFPTPFGLVYGNFTKLGYDKKDCEYFAGSASGVVETLRAACWNDFLPGEREFTSDMLHRLIDADDIKGMGAERAITWFVEEFPEHIYALTLSNTQSRRSRAGKEFESIIELILLGAGVPVDSQANIGKKIFIDKGLGKLVDVVSPGIVEYLIDKSDAVLISAKTTLRERWQEVPEEMGRTGAREMFLATLDEEISDEVLETLYEANIRVTTTRNIKETFYKDNKRVLDFERLVEICMNNYTGWDSYDYSEKDIEQAAVIMNGQMDKHNGRGFMMRHYRDRIEKMRKRGGRQ